MTDERASDGWLPGTTAPSKVGVYERRSALGITFDAWDGKEWRRHGETKNFRHRVEDRPTQFPGIVCANQNLPWRSPA